MSLIPQEITTASWIASTVDNILTCIKNMRINHAGSATHAMWADLYEQYERTYAKLQAQYNNEVMAEMIGGGARW